MSGDVGGSRLDTEARKYVRQRQAWEKADAAAKKAAEKYEEAKQALMDLMDDLKQSSAVVDLGDPIGKIRLNRPKPTIYARIIDKDVALASIEAARRTEEMFDFEIRKAPANQWIKELLERGEEIPPGFDYSSSERITLTYLKEKK